MLANCRRRTLRLHCDEDGQRPGTLLADRKLALVQVRFHVVDAEPFKRRPSTDEAIEERAAGWHRPQESGCRSLGPLHAVPPTAR